MTNGERSATIDMGALFRGVQRRDLMAIVSSLAAVTALSWLYLWRNSLQMESMAAEAGSMNGMAMATAWSVETLALAFVMWTVMMAGMMLPSAAPAIVLYGSLVRKNRERGTVLAPTWVFTGGYLAVWTAFSLVVTLVQSALSASGLLTPMMGSNNAWLSGGLLIAAGVYQWLPFKDACLRKCRAPLSFFIARWRPGRAGTFRMGVEHGAFCVGCCWAIMMLLFAAGVMNLLWVAAITGFVFVEKLIPGGRRFERLAGAAAAAGGLALLVAQT